MCYHKGLGVKVDFSKAMQWYSTAAAQGHAMGQWKLGTVFQNRDC